MKTRKFWNTLITLALTMALVLSMAVPTFAMGGSSNSSFAGGTGTASDPYHIQTVDQLETVRNDLGASYVLDNDLDLSSISNFQPIGTYLPDTENTEFALESTSFHGTFDGNGHKIKNVNMSRAWVSALFGAVSGTGYVHDLVMENVNSKGLMYAGAFVGMATDRARLENLTLIGDNNNIEGLMQVGGIVGGCNIPVLKNLSAKANVTSKGMDQLGMNAGIVCGGGDGTSFENCKATGGTLTCGGMSSAPSFGFGGLSGCAMGADHVTDCSVEDVVIKVHDANQVGGLFGFAGTPEGQTPTRIENCDVKNVTIEVGDNVERVGGMVGGSTYLAGSTAKPHNFTISNSSVSGEITGGSIVGGVVGWLSNGSSIADDVVYKTGYHGGRLVKVGATEAQLPTSTFDSISSDINLVMNSMMGSTM